MPEFEVVATKPPLGGQKTHLVFTPYLLTSKSMDVDTSRSYSVMLNPAEIKLRRSIGYNDERTVAGVRRTPRFSSIGTDTLDLSIVMDGTGVVPAADRSSAASVQQQLEQLEAAVYHYHGTDKQPPCVRILWGSLIFGGRLQSMSTRFTLFEPSGAPLRASVDLAFIGSTSREAVEAILEIAAADSQIQEREVREGDTLPLLCQMMCGDSTRWPEVARLNGLQWTRKLEPGTKLRFPPAKLNRG